MLTKKLSCQSSQAGSGTLEDHKISIQFKAWIQKNQTTNYKGWDKQVVNCLVEQPHCHLAWPLAELASVLGGGGLSFGWCKFSGQLEMAGRYRSKCLIFIFHIDSLTDTNRVVWVTNLLEDILLGVGHKLNWIYGPRQICQIDFSRHLRRKYLSDAQERGLNFLQPSELLLLYLVFSANLAWRLTPPMAGAQKLAPLMGFWDLRDGAPSSVLSHWKWICSSVKAQIDFCSCCLHKELNL